MITVSGVSKDYHSETRHTYHRVLSNVSFAIGPGEKIRSQLENIAILPRHDRLQSQPAVAVTAKMQHFAATDPLFCAAV